jgi:pyrophosphatase PpaX
MTNTRSPNLKAIVFDMDGTLVSSLSTIWHCESEISQKYTGKPLTLEDVISKFGPPARTIVRDLTTGLSERVQSQAISDYYECYSKTIKEKGIIFPGITTLLQRIQSTYKLLGLFTGVERKMMEFTLAPFDVAKFFKTIVTADDVKKSKPDPEGVLTAVKRLDAKLAESIYIGDSPSDIQAGKKAGVLTGAALWSPENRGDPTTEQPDYEFRSVDQLSEFLFPSKKLDQEPYLGSQWTSQ